MTSEIKPNDLSGCPVCAGTGKETHTYHYRPQHRSDMNREDIQRSMVCSLCSGTGEVTQAQLDAWQQVQAQPLCPVCKGQGGKYFWQWDEGEQGTRKQFYVEACSLCGGEKHITPIQLEAHERERRKLRWWGVGCATVAVVGGLFAVTQVVSLLVYQTPWVQCCAPPNVVFVGSILMMTRGIRWFI